MSFFRILSILMAIVAVKGTVFVFTDREFDYAGLPMPLVYIMLVGFVVLTVYTLWSTFIKKA